MAADSLHLIISSVGGAQFDGLVVSATFPGTAGDFTVLARHEPLVTTLKKGVISVRMADNSKKEFPIESGVLEHSGSRSVVLL